MEAKARELFTQLTRPLATGQGTTEGGHSGVGQQFSTLPCKLKVHIKISPTAADPNSEKTLENHEKADQDDEEEEVVVAEIIEESPEP